MPAPVVLPGFSTDALYAADGDAWSGTPPRVDPGVPIRAEGFEPGVLPAEWLNFVIGNHGDWATWLEAERLRLAGYIGGAAGAGEWAYPAGRARVRMIPLAHAQPNDDADWAWSVVGSGGDPYWLKTGVVGRLRAALIVPNGAIITRVAAIVLPFSAANSIRVNLRSRIWSAGYGTLTSATHAGTAGTGGATRHVIEAIPGTPPTIQNSTDEYHVEIVSTVTGDQVEGLFVEYTDPGPRNY